VALYTQYYHDWKAKEAEEERRAQTLYGSQQQEAVRQAAWAKYYADQASRAAHYFLNPQGQPQPDLPPAPPKSATTSSTVKQQPAIVQAPQQSPAQKSHQSPGGLKRYVHRCLERCTAKEQLQHMQAEVQKIISQALKDGTMHTTNWDTKELIPMQGEEHKTLPNTTPPQNGTKGQNKQLSPISNDSSYYGSQGQNKQLSPISNDSSYYGPSWHSYHQREVTQNEPREKLQQNNSYYGPSNSKSPPDDFIKVPAISKKQQKKADKKRKANSVEGFEASSHTLSKRANRFSGAGGLIDASSSATTLARNFDKYMGKGLIGGSGKLEESDFEKMTVKGTCRVLEKDYLRLTAPPRAELVRPQEILERHLQNLVEERQSKKRRDYVWFCSQFKAMRQDLTVQRIFNEFAVRVYETHARVALEENDLNEYNQCQTQLKELYTMLASNKEAVANLNEFISYRIIYYVFLTGNKKYDGGSSDLFKIMLSLTTEQRKDPAVIHALKVRSAVADFDYHAFFRLQKDCPTPGMAQLMRFLVPTVRHWTLHRMCKAYRPNISVEFAMTELGFECNEFENACSWLESCGCVLSEDRKTWDTKESVIRESDQKLRNSLI
jgi:hypothetical protein